MIVFSGTGQRGWYVGSCPKPLARSTAQWPPGSAACSSATTCLAIAGSSGNSSIARSLCRSHRTPPLAQIATPRWPVASSQRPHPARRSGRADHDQRAGRLDARDRAARPLVDRSVGSQQRSIQITRDDPEIHVAMLSGGAKFPLPFGRSAVASIRGPRRRQRRRLTRPGPRRPGRSTAEPEESCCRRDRRARGSTRRSCRAR